ERRFRTPRPHSRLPEVRSGARGREWARADSPRRRAEKCAPGGARQKSPILRAADANANAPSLRPAPNPASEFGPQRSAAWGLRHTAITAAHRLCGTPSDEACGKTADSITKDQKRPSSIEQGSTIVVTT